MRKSRLSSEVTGEVRRRGINLLGALTLGLIAVYEAFSWLATTAAQEAMPDYVQQTLRVMSYVALALPA